MPCGTFIPFFGAGFKILARGNLRRAYVALPRGKKGKSPCHCMFPREPAPLQPAYSRLIDMYALGAWLAPPRIHRASLNYLQRKSSKCLSVVGCRLSLRRRTLVKIQDKDKVQWDHHGS